MKTKKFIKWEDRKAKQPKLPPKLLSRLGAPVETVNVSTVNGWCFDGWVGTSTKFTGDYCYEVGIIGTRHQGTFPKKVVYVGRSLRFSVDEFCKIYDTGCRTTDDFFNHRYQKPKTK